MTTGGGRAWRSLWRSPSSEEIWILRELETVSSPLLRGCSTCFFFREGALSKKIGVSGVVCVWNHANAC